MNGPATTVVRFADLVELLAANARDDRSVTFIDGERDRRPCSFARLRQRAIAMLGALQRRGARPGGFVVLYLNDNERLLEMFWACLLGGIVPVPLATGGSDEHRLKLFRVLAKLDRAWVYVDAPSRERLDAFAPLHGFGADWNAVGGRLLMPGSLDLTGAPGAVRIPQPDDTAFIQFSSGSTGEPKGIVLTHANLCTNTAAIAAGAAFTDADIALSWMPLTHDMGLIGFHLAMLGAGVSHMIMRTDLFARRPMLWLELATQGRCTLLCSPNFGYQHYLKQAEGRPPHDVDLSAVRLIFNGAEPISAEVCRRFDATMRRHGLGPNRMFPVYGLAEASLAVSFPSLGAPMRTVWLDRASLGIGKRAERVPAGRVGASEFVLCGRGVPWCEIAITDPAGVPLEDGTFGHIRIRGDNVTPGFHGDPQATAAVRSADGWFDTGDLGVFIDGELVIGGRAKELIILNGQNVYPHDLERIAETVPGIEANRIVAGGVRHLQDDVEALALFVLNREPLPVFAELAARLRRTVAAQSGLDATYVVPVSRIPKTTSGKLQRYTLVHSFEAGEFADPLAELDILSAAQNVTVAGAPEGSTVARLVAVCRRTVPGAGVAPDTNLLEINLNSLSLARIHEAIDREYPQRIDVTDLFEYPTLDALAAFLDRHAV